MWIHHVMKSIYIPDATWGVEIAHGIICMHNPEWLHAADLTIPRKGPPLLGGPRHVTKVAAKTQAIALAWKQD